MIVSLAPKIYQELPTTDSLRNRMKIQTTRTSPKSAGTNIGSPHTAGIDVPEILSRQDDYRAYPNRAAVVSVVRSNELALPGNLLDVVKPPVCCLFGLLLAYCFPAGGVLLRG